MCLCTHYDSPTCGHSWISMTHPCGFCRDFLNCPNHSIIQVLIAPPYVCPVCNGGFADHETIQMIHGPWGCNQLIRRHWGGDAIIPGQWGNVHLHPTNWGSHPTIPGHWNANQMLLTGTVPQVGSHLMPSPYDNDAPLYFNDAEYLEGWDDRAIGPYRGYGRFGRNRRRRHSYYREYRQSSRPTGCTVM